MDCKLLLVLFTNSEWRELKHQNCDLPIYQATLCKCFKYGAHTAQDLGKRINEKIVPETRIDDAVQ